MEVELSKADWTPGVNNVSDQGKGQALASRVMVLRMSSLERWGQGIH